MTQNTKPTGSKGPRLPATVIGKEEIVSIVRRIKRLRQAPDRKLNQASQKG